MEDSSKGPESVARQGTFPISVVIFKPCSRAFAKKGLMSVLRQVHAENGDGVLQAQQKTVAAGITGPEGHYISRPDFLEVKSTTISLLCQSPPLR